MPVPPLPYQLEDLEGLEPHPEHPADHPDATGRAHLHATSGIARMTLVFPAGSPPPRVELVIDGWTDALEGASLQRPDGQHLSLTDTASEGARIENGRLMLVLPRQALDWLAPGTRLQLIDRYR